MPTHPGARTPAGAPISAVLQTLALLLAVSPCCAQVKARPAPAAMSRQELKTCFLKEDELKARDQALRNAVAAQDADTEVLSQEGKQLAEAMRAIDPADRAAVDEFNRHNDDRNRRVEVYNKRGEALNATQSDFQAAQADHMAACSTRPYLLRDRDAVLRELGRLPAKPGESAPKGKRAEGGRMDT